MFSDTIFHSSASISLSVSRLSSLIIIHISCVRYDSVLSLARQWTMEDEEEVEREKRRRVKSSGSTAEPTADCSQTTGDTPTSDSPFGTDSTSGMSQIPSRLFSRFRKEFYSFINLSTLDL